MRPWWSLALIAIPLPAEYEKVFAQSKSILLPISGKCQEKFAVCHTLPIFPCHGWQSLAFSWFEHAR